MHTPNDNKTCPTCGGALIQKSRIKLFLAGMILMVLSSIVLIFNFKFWPFAILPILTAVYLIVWSSLGKGYWCRQCKNFPYK